MGEEINLRFRLITGRTETITVSQHSTVLAAKKLLHNKLPDAPAYRQKLISADRTILEDGKILSSYPAIKHGSIVSLIILEPWIVYVQDPHSKIFEIEIPSNEPELFPITDLRALVESKSGQRLDEYEFQFNGVAIEESQHGKKFTLKDWNIKKLDTIFLVKMGFSLNITSPKMDICFMMDCTGSMGSWIESVKQNVKNIRDSLEKAYKGCDMQFAFVRYTDYDQPQHSRTTWINFTNSLSQFHSFVDPIKADGGDDTQEDIMGGLKITFSELNWRHDAAKVLIHIADAPCHGTQYHSLSGDSYPSGDPAGITHDQMMSEVVRLDIQYWFGFIQRGNTDKMIDVFNDSLKSKSDHRLIIRQFEAVQYQQLGDAVHKSVTASVFASEAKKKISCGTFDKSEPNWAYQQVHQGYKTPPPGPKSLQNLQDGLKLEKPSVSFLVKISPSPFSEGEEAVIYLGYDVRNSRKIIVKKLKTDDSTLDSHMKILEIQTISSTYANEFNCNKKKPLHLPNIEFIPVDIAQMDNGSFYVVQPFVEGTFEKYNTNNGIVYNSTDSEMMQSFSHFTFVHSEGSILICDLEGVKSARGFHLSDPAIHNRHQPKKYGNTDKGFLGMKQFFKSHTCNSICREMGLEGTSA